MSILAGKGDNDIYFVGEATSRVWEKILLTEAHTDPTFVQHEDERDKSGDLPH